MIEHVIKLVGEFCWLVQ